MASEVWRRKCCSDELGTGSERRVIGSEYLPTVGRHWPFNGYVMGVKAIP